MRKIAGTSIKASPPQRAGVKPPVPVAPTFYHGTSALAAMCICVDGFRLLSSLMRQWGTGALGNGIYVTAALETADFFASVASHKQPRHILRVRLAPGTRILRMDGQYDRGVINYLAREFGRELLGPRFDRAIPSNKHLSRVELINLANYLWAMGEADNPRGIGAWAGLERLGPLRRTLMHSKYDGFGCTKSDLGVLLFNPSRLLAEDVFVLPNNGNTVTGQADTALGPSALIKVDPHALAIAAAKVIGQSIRELSTLRASLAASTAKGKTDFAEFDRLELEDLLSEIPRWQGCLRLYCARHQIPAETPVIASALRSIPL